MIGTDIKSNPVRMEYEAKINGLAEEGNALISAAHGDPVQLEAAARYMAQKRLDISAQYKHATPEPLLEYIFHINSRYDTKWGPSFKFLMDKYKGDFITIIQKAATPNPDINKLLFGFRDWLKENGAKFLNTDPK